MKIGNSWPEHLEKMYRFWQTILLEVHSYSGSPFLHTNIYPLINPTLIDGNFIATVDGLFKGPIAEEAKLRAKNMAEMFNYKINYFRDADQKAIL
jgi:hemoglobin